MLFTTAIAGQLCLAHAQTAPAVATVPASAPRDEPRLTLLDPGAEPRILLRFKPLDRSTRAFEIIVQVVTATSVDGVDASPAIMPAIHVACRVTIEHLHDGGSVPFSFAVTDAHLIDSPDVAPDLAQSARQAVRSLTGLSGSGVMSDRGVAREPRINTPANADPALAASLQQQVGGLVLASRPFPDAPVGVGARWRIDSVDLLDGVRSDLVQNCTLTAVDGQRIALRIESSQSASPQPMPGAAAPPGATAWLDEGRVTTETDIALDLAHIAPISEATRKVLVFRAHTRGGEAPQRRMSQRQETTVTLRQVAVQPTGSQPATAPANP